MKASLIVSKLVRKIPLKYHNCFYDKKIYWFRILFIDLIIILSFILFKMICYFFITSPPTKVLTPLFVSDFCDTNNFKERVVVMLNYI